MLAHFFLWETLSESGGLAARPHCLIGMCWPDYDYIGHFITINSQMKNHAYTANILHARWQQCHYSVFCPKYHVISSQAKKKDVG